MCLKAPGLEAQACAQRAVVSKFNAKREGLLIPLAAEKRPLAAPQSWSSHRFSCGQTTGMTHVDGIIGHLQADPGASDCIGLSEMLSTAASVKTPASSSAVANT